MMPIPQLRPETLKTPNLELGRLCLGLGLRLLAGLVGADADLGPVELALLLGALVVGGGLVGAALVEGLADAGDDLGGGGAVVAPGGCLVLDGDEAVAVSPGVTLAVLEALGDNVALLGGLELEDEEVTFVSYVSIKG
jgi:hypothetical protein